MLPSRSLAFLSLAVLPLGALPLAHRAAHPPAHTLAQPIVQDVARRLARVVWFADQGGPVGEVAIQYGQPEWKDDYAAKFDELTAGKRWRFGKDFWTTLDTNLELTVATKKIHAGIYYLVLECDKKKKWSLVLLEPDKLQKQTLDAFAADTTKGGFEIPLTYEKTETPAKALSVQVTVEKQKPGSIDLVIAFGPHKLTGKLQAKV